MEQRFLSILIIAGGAMTALAIIVGFMLPVQKAPTTLPPTPTPPTFTPYHVEALKDSTFAATYGTSGAKVLGSHPEIVTALVKVDPGFDAVHVSEAATMAVAEFADKRELLIISGCLAIGCQHGGYAAGYDLNTKKAYLIETTDPAHLRGVTYGEPDESYTRVLTEELGRITARAQNYINAPLGVPEGRATCARTGLVDDGALFVGAERSRRSGRHVVTVEYGDCHARTDFAQPLCQS